MRGFTAFGAAAAAACAEPWPQELMLTRVPLPLPLPFREDPPGWSSRSPPAHAALEPPPPKLGKSWLLLPSGKGPSEDEDEGVGRCAKQASQLRDSGALMRVHLGGR